MYLFFYLNRSFSNGQHQIWSFYLYVKQLKIIALHQTLDGNNFFFVFADRSVLCMPTTWEKIIVIILNKYIQLTKNTLIADFVTQIAIGNSKRYCVCSFFCMDVTAEAQWKLLYAHKFFYRFFSVHFFYSSKLIWMVLLS